MLADAQNPQVQFARARVQAAEAERDRADVLWLPNLSLGSSWTRHDGQIQDTQGEVITVSRSALFAGGGPVAGVDLAEAYYEPLAARQLVSAQQAGERATTNDILLDVALGYWELVRAQADAAIAEETRENARQLDELAQSYLRAEKLKPADAERVRAEYQARIQALEAARERVQVVSAQLARRLRLDPFVVLQPADKQALPISMIDVNTPPADLVTLALTGRPELAQSRALVGLATEKLRQATYGPLLPSVLLGYRAGGFGGGRNSFFGDFDGRSDFDAAVVWELRNLSLGDHALRRQRDSELQQAAWRDLAEMDRVVADVATFLAQARSRGQQLKSAELAVQSASRSYELSFKLFKDAGLEAIRPIEVLQAIQTHARTRQDYLSAVIEHNRAQFQLHWALGYPVQEPPSVR